MSFQSALVGLDLSKVSDLMVRWLPNLRDLCTRKLYLFHVIPLTSVEHVVAGASAYRIVENEIVDSKRKLEEYARYLSEKGFEVTVLDPEIGEPARKIVKVSEDVNADYIVLGSRGHSWLSQVLLGSTVEEVSHTSKKRVLVIKGFVRKGLRELTIPPPLFTGSPIVVAVDVESEECTRPVVDCVRELSKCYREHREGRRLFLHVVYVDEHGIGVAEARRRIKEFFDELSGEAVLTPELYEKGSPAKIILARVEELKADLVVVGPCGKGGSLSRRLLGTTADVVLRRSPVHVLICR